MLPGGHLLVAKEKKPAALLEFGPPDSHSRGLARGGALPDGARWPIRKGRHRFVAVAIWRPDKTLARTCADFSDLEIGPDGHLYLLSDKSSTIARLDNLPPGGGTASLIETWHLGDLDGKPEGLAFTPQGHAIVGPTSHGKAAWADFGPIPNFTCAPAASALVRPAHKLHGVFDMAPGFGQFDIAIPFEVNGVLTASAMALAPCASSNCRASMLVDFDFSHRASLSFRSAHDDRDHQLGAGTADVNTFKALTVCILARDVCKSLFWVTGSRELIARRLFAVQPHTKRIP